MQLEIRASHDTMPLPSNRQDSLSTASNTGSSWHPSLRPGWLGRVQPYESTQPTSLVL